MYRMYTVPLWGGIQLGLSYCCCCWSVSARYYRTQEAFFLNFLSIRTEADAVAADDEEDELLLFFDGDGDGEYCRLRSSASP